MPMWRCPHCGTPQAESSRCWVCKRSSTSCGTCRHFRRAIAVQLGFCGLDRLRKPLRGDELRGCWEARPAATWAEVGSPTGERVAAGSVPERPRLDFVPIDAVADVSGGAPVVAPPPAAAPSPPAVAVAPDTSLGFWADEA